jgi:outer membrane protein
VTAVTRRAAALVLLLSGAATLVRAQESPPILKLQEAQELALSNRPNLRARQLNAQAAGQTTAQFEATRYPQIYGNLTAATAYQEHTTRDGQDVTLDSRIAAGGLNNPLVLQRNAAGIALSQLITDFGRTSKLIQSAKLNETSQQQLVNATRAQVLLEVNDAYYGVLEAQAVLRVAQKTVEARKTIQDRVTALAKSRLKSELDVRFAQVNLGEAQLLQLRARNAVDAGFARLSAALGYREPHRYQLVDQPGSDARLPDLEALTKDAIATRPELASLRADQESAGKYAQAQKALRYPTINAYAAGGAVGAADPRFPNTYGAIGVNLNLALFDGGKINALQKEAQLRALAVSENLSEAENNVVRGVRVAWLNATSAYENITITQRLLDAAQQALKLAESRYNLGITSIVELNQAQLSSIDAEIAASRAKYEYLSARSVLDFQVGTLDSQPR